jgi:FkbM family methyltransferase
MLKTFIKNIFNMLGLDINKKVYIPSAEIFLNIDLILDVGANTGQFALLARRRGYVGAIVSFEPTPEAHHILSQRRKNDFLWTIYPRCAVGSSNYQTTINISKNSYSSSILNILDTHTSAAPDSMYVDSVEVDVIALDSIMDIYSKEYRNIFLKIDTQGFEAEVLSGCLSSLSIIKAVQLELSNIPLYEGQKLFQYFFDFFENHNFYLWSINPVFFDPKTGQQLQFDAIFINSNKC